MSDLDSAFERFQLLSKEISANYDKIISEEDAKFQIITRILTEVLGWGHKDVRCETNHDNGYSDYVVSNRGMDSFVIEAKRIGILEVETAETTKVRHLKINGPGLRKCIEGIEQTVKYASPNGMILSVLTDGMIWVCFKSFVPNSNYKEKQAIVFPSFEAIESSFSTFFDLLSRESFEKKLYNTIFDDIHQNRLFLTNPLKAPYDISEIDVVRKHGIAFELEKIFDTFFSRLQGNGDDDMLIDCFVESRESRIADFSLEKITANVLGNIAPRDTNVGAELANIIRGNLETDVHQVSSGKTIFIVGPTGAGKSTFLERFFERTLSRTVREKCVVVSVNCLDHSGNKLTAASWLTEQIIHSIEEENFTEGDPSWEELLGLFHSEYVRQAKGVHKNLYESDKAAFKIKFGEFIERQVERDREGYLRRLLSDTVKNRKKLPTLVFDNTDELDITTKENIFHYAQSIQRNVKHCLVIFPMTDKSAWAFSKQDIYSIYKSKSFFLPTPSPRDVLKKRIDYINTKLEIEDKRENSEKYLTDRGITISIDDVHRFAKVLEDVFIEHDFSSKTIGELANFNIRTALTLAQRAITSSVFNIDDLIKSYVTGSPVSAGFAKFMNALLKGDYQLYRRGDKNEIYPIFQSSSEIRHSPLLILRILSLLKNARESNKSLESRHLQIQSIYDYFEALGCTENAVDFTLSEGIKSGLIEPFDMSNTSLTSGQRVAISARGLVHFRLATNDNVFFEQMALTTGISDEVISDSIRSIHSSKEPNKDRLFKVRKVFSEYLIAEDKKYIQLPKDLQKYTHQTDLLGLIEKFTFDNSINAFDAHTYSLSGVKAVVDFFDDVKGFGFADLLDKNSTERVFFHISNFREIGVETISDGDVFVCDVIPNKKGPTVSKVHDILYEDAQIETSECTIIRLREDRGYGFVNINGTDRDAFFHFSLLQKDEKHHLTEGMVITAQIVPDPKIDGWQVRKILDLNLE